MTKKNKFIKDSSKVLKKSKLCYLPLQVTANVWLGAHTLSSLPGKQPKLPSSVIVKHRRAGYY